MRIVKPMTSGQRGVIYEDRSDITSNKPHKKLTKKIKKRSGRDWLGHISIRHRGGGAKKKYRIINFSMIPDLVARVISIEYDPYRNARIALIESSGLQKYYILAPVNLKVGNTINWSKNTEIKLGNRLILDDIPTGTFIHNIELTPQSKAKIVRSAGTSAVILSKDDNWINIKLPSSEVRKFHKNCYASIGQVSNIEHKLISFGNAGRKRHLGIRPTVRGKAMYPAAHPHGGGEGVNPIGLKHPKTKWGKPARGVKTRSRSKVSNQLIIKKRN